MIVVPRDWLESELQGLELARGGGSLEILPLSKQPSSCIGPSRRFAIGWNLDASPEPTSGAGPGECHAPRSKKGYQPTTNACDSVLGEQCPGPGSDPGQRREGGTTKGKCCLSADNKPLPII
jgi:hypothetical protein